MNIQIILSELVLRVQDTDICHVTVRMPNLHHRLDYYCDDILITKDK